MRRSRLPHAVAAIVLLAFPLLLFGERALAIQDSEDKVLFGPVGIGVGEGARRHSTSSTTIASVR